MISSYVIVNHPNSQVPDDQLAAIASACQTQLIRDVAPRWGGVGGTVRVASAQFPPTQFERVIALLDHLDQAGAYGYHDMLEDGAIVLPICPPLDIVDGHPPSVTISHEILETEIDPWLGRCSFSTASGDGRVIWATEICDAVERDMYQVDGVMVSNFVFPSYFEPPRAAKPPFDYLGLISSPLAVSAGGYNQWLDGEGWHQVAASQRPGRLALAASKLGRGSRRAMQWRSGRA